MVARSLVKASRRGLAASTCAALLALGCSHSGDGPADAAPPMLHPPTLAGGFTDLTDGVTPPFTLAPATDDGGLQREAENSAGFFADVDGDGKNEVVLTSGSLRFDDAVAIYHYDADGGLTPAPAIANLHAPLAAAIDLDDDGFLDLVITQPTLQVAWGAAGNPATFLGTVQPASEMARGGTAVPYLDDIDGDGWLDLLLGEPCCQLGCTDLHPMLQIAARTFHDGTSLVNETTPNSPTSVMVTRFHDGQPMLASLGFSCIDPESAPVFFSQSGVDQSGYPTFAPFDPFPMNAAFRTMTNGGILNSLSANSPMGAAVADVDGDGQLDLFVALNPLHAWYQGQPQWPFVDLTFHSEMALAPSDDGNDMLPWGAAILDLDRDGRLDVIAAHGHDAAGWFQPPARFVGPQHASAWWNGGDFRFADITDQLKLGRRGQFRAVSVGDLDGDGDPDLIIGGEAETPRVFRNDVNSGNQGFALRLHGSSSNHLGIGSTIEVVVGDGSPTRHYYAGGIASPDAVSEPLVFVALGTAGSASKTTIHWPSGMVQEVDGLGAGSVHRIEEPPLFAIAPATRHAPLAGGSFTLTVTPRNPDGTTRDGVVTARSVYGGGTVGAATKSSGGYTVSITPPASGTSTVIDIQIDGTSLGVRPRLFWD